MRILWLLQGREDRLERYDFEGFKWGGCGTPNPCTSCSTSSCLVKLDFIGQHMRILQSFSPCWTQPDQCHEAQNFLSLQSTDKSVEVDERPKSGGWKGVLNGRIGVKPPANQADRTQCKGAASDHDRKALSPASRRREAVPIPTASVVHPVPPRTGSGCDCAARLPDLVHYLDVGRPASLHGSKHPIAAPLRTKAQTEVVAKGMVQPLIASFIASRTRVRYQPLIMPRLYSRVSQPDCSARCGRGETDRPPCLPVPT